MAYHDDKEKILPKDERSSSNMFNNICTLLAWFILMLFLLTTIAMLIAVIFLRYGELNKVNLHQPKKLVTPLHTPVSWKDKNTTSARQAILRKRYELHRAIFRANSMCKLNVKVMKIEELLKEDPVLEHDLQNIIIPYEAVVLNRCLGNCSYSHHDCKPAMGYQNKTKEIAIMIYNASVRCIYPVLKPVYVCQP